MKKTFLFLTVLMISLISVKGQNQFYSCVINFEDNPCWMASYYSVNIPDSNNVWQVCTPYKTVFDSAHSSPKAILTDSTGPYPVNIISSFIIKFVFIDYCACEPVIGGYYKFDSDTLKDYGRIEFSLDNGITWLNALSDTVIPYQNWLTPKPVLTGRIHQWREFRVSISEYSNWDTLYYRFTFISDSIQTNQEGWMLDDLPLIDWVEGIQDIGFRNEINIHPNPASTHITIETPIESQLSILNLNGQELLKQTTTEPKTVIDISTLPNGIYFVRVTGDKAVGVGKFIKQ